MRIASLASIAFSPSPFHTPLMVRFETRVHVDDLSLDPDVTPNPEFDPDTTEPTTITIVYESVQVVYDISYDADNNVTDFDRTVSDA